jgi:putative iron-only hydrogenase system regulator
MQLFQHVLPPYAGRAFFALTIDGGTPPLPPTAGRRRYPRRLDAAVTTRRRDAVVTPAEPIMETRVALIGIIVEEPDSVGPLNELLHEYRQYIIGRMGIPYKPRNISVISVTIDAPMDVISSLSGKLGMLKGVTSKALMAKLQ